MTVRQNRCLCVCGFTCVYTISKWYYVHSDIAKGGSGRPAHAIFMPRLLCVWYALWLKLNSQLNSQMLYLSSQQHYFDMPTNWTLLFYCICIAECTWNISISLFFHFYIGTVIRTEEWWRYMAMWNYSLPRTQCKEQLSSSYMISVIYNTCRWQQ